MMSTCAESVSATAVAALCQKGRFEEAAVRRAGLWRTAVLGQDFH
jgi:hypothetical protein